VKNLFFKRSPLNSINDAILIHNKSEFDSPTCSSVPLLSFLKHERKTFESFLTSVGVSPECNWHLEYTVKSPKGEGSPSHSDVMVIDGDVALAIEAKWTEPKGKTIDDWYPTVDSMNGPLVLNGWLELLQPRATRKLRRADFSGAIIQMVHRAASACYAGNNPNLAFLLFTPSPSRQTATALKILNDLAHLWCLLGKPAKFPFFLVQVGLQYTEAFKRIASLQKGSKETAETVKQALVDTKPLFKFSEPSILNIGDLL